MKKWRLVQKYSLLMTIMILMLSCTSGFVKSRVAKEKKIYFKTVFIAMRGLDSTKEFYAGLSNCLKGEFEARGISSDKYIFDISASDSEVLTQKSLSGKQHDIILMISQYAMKKAGFKSSVSNKSGLSFATPTPPPLVFDVKVYTSADEIVWRAVLHSVQSDIMDKSLFSCERLVEAMVNDGVLISFDR